MSSISNVLVGVVKINRPTGEYEGGVGGDRNQDPTVRKVPSNHNDWSIRGEHPRVKVEGINKMLTFVIELSISYLIFH